MVTVGCIKRTRHHRELFYYFKCFVELFQRLKNVLRTSLVISVIAVSFDPPSTIIQHL